MRWTAIAAILLGCAASFQNANASAYSTPDLDGQRTIVLKISDLRSAYLHRAGIVRYDNANLSPDGVRQQLRRHFDVVLGLLLVSTPQSIETALARLEAAGGRVWSESERADHRRQLLAMRYVQLQRLAAYRDRGLFPQNEGHANHAVPIFVDRHDTACAVGQLMLWSGWDDAVKTIRTADNLVYLPDAAHSSIEAWAITSGITIEEAALIQPGYPPPLSQTQLSDLLQANAHINDHGLRFENFTFAEAAYADLVGACSPGSTNSHLCNPSLAASLASIPLLFTSIQNPNAPNAQTIGVRADIGKYSPPPSGTGFTPVGTNWLFLGARVTQVGDATLNASAQEGNVQFVSVSFDVSTIDPNQAINKVTEGNADFIGGLQYICCFGGDDDDGNYYLQTLIKDGSNTLATLNENRQDPGTHLDFSRIASAEVAPRQRLHLETTIMLTNQVSLDSFYWDFNVVAVPEPSVLLISVTALVVGCAARVRRRT
jgi:hypothetical protein